MIAQSFRSLLHLSFVYFFFQRSQALVACSGLFLQPHKKTHQTLVTPLALLTAYFLPEPFFFILALRHPHHDDHERLRTWVGVHFDPELFSVQQLKSAFAVE